jgi:8-oxo-dGTP pyrophosphatase MutT (NUDIX family)
MSGNKNYTNICQNCGIKGHHIRNCNNPITSLGVVLYNRDKKGLKYLLVRRKNTIGFVEFIRGKYAINDKTYILQLFNVMTENEIQLITDKDFPYLWEFLWMDKRFNKTSQKVKRDYDAAFEKFKKIKEGYGENKISIEYFIEKKDKFYIEQEWGFPKGRRNFNENNYNAAIREFIEETNIKKKDIISSPESESYSEIYISYDNIQYQNIYYLAEYTGDGNFTIDKSKHEQFTEISNIDFFPINNVMNKLRDYDVEKKRLINQIDEILVNK